MHETSDLTTAPRPNKNNTSIFDCPESFAKWYCLNGATCFSVKIRDSTLYNCWCPLGFHGLRCDYKYVERRSQQTGSNHNQPASTFTATHTSQGNNREQHSATANDAQQKTKDFHLTIVYNIIVVLLIVLIILLTLRTLKKRGLIIKTMRRANEDNLDVQHNNGQINQDCATIEFGPLKQGERSHQHHHDRSRAELQKQEFRQQLESQLQFQMQLQQQQQQQQLNQSHWMHPIFTTDHQQRCEPA